MNILETLENELRKTNGRKRVRTLSVRDVCATIAAAVQNGFGWMTGGNVDANSYGYPSTSTAVAAVRIRIKRENLIAVKFGLANAGKGHSPVTWFGPASVRHVPEWAKTVEPQTLIHDGWIFLEEDLARAITKGEKAVLCYLDSVAVCCSAPEAGCDGK